MGIADYTFAEGSALSAFRSSICPGGFGRTFQEQMPVKRGTSGVMAALLSPIPAFVLAICVLHQTIHAAPIPIPENRNDTAEFVITNYSWVNTGVTFINVCDRFQDPCDITTRLFSDRIQLFNGAQDGLAHIRFVSDLESPVRDTPLPTDVFLSESPEFSFDADATATNGVVATLRINFTSDGNPDPRPEDLPSDSVEVILRPAPPPPPKDAPLPKVQSVPEPSILLPLGAALVGLTWYRKRSGFGSINKKGTLNPRSFSRPER